MQFKLLINRGTVSSILIRSKNRNIKLECDGDHVADDARVLHTSQHIKHRRLVGEVHIR